MKLAFSLLLALFVIYTVGTKAKGTSAPSTAAPTKPPLKSCKNEDGQQYGSIGQKWPFLVKFSVPKAKVQTTIKGIENQIPFADSWDVTKYIRKHISTINKWWSQNDVGFVSGRKGTIKFTNQYTRIPLDPSQDYFHFKNHDTIAFYMSNCLNNNEIPRSIFAVFPRITMAGLLKFGIEGVGYSASDDITYYMPNYWDGKEFIPRGKVFRAMFWFKGHASKKNSKLAPLTKVTELTNSWLSVTGGDLEMFMSLPTAEDINPTVKEFPVKFVYKLAGTYSIRSNIESAGIKLPGIGFSYLAKLVLSPPRGVNIVIDKNAKTGGIELSLAGTWVHSSFAPPAGQKPSVLQKVEKVLVEKGAKKLLKNVIPPGQTGIQIRFSSAERWLGIRYHVTFSFLAVVATLKVGFNLKKFAGLEIQLALLFPTVNNIAELAFLQINSVLDTVFSLIRKAIGAQPLVGQEVKTYKEQALKTETYWKGKMCQKECLEAAKQRCNNSKKRRGFWGFLKKAYCKILSPVQTGACKKVKCPLLYLKYKVMEAIRDAVIWLEGRIRLAIGVAEDFTKKALKNVPIPENAVLTAKIGKQSDIKAEDYGPILKFTFSATIKIVSRTAALKENQDKKIKSKNCLAFKQACIPACKDTPDPDRNDTSYCIPEGTPYPKGTECCERTACSFHRSWQCLYKFIRPKTKKFTRRTYSYEFDLGTKLKSLTSTLIDFVQGTKSSTPESKKKLSLEAGEQQAAELNEVLKEVQEQKDLPKDPAKMEKDFLEKYLEKHSEKPGNKRSIEDLSEDEQTAIKTEYWDRYINDMIEIIDKKAEQAERARVNWKKENCNPLVHDCPKKH